MSDPYDAAPNRDADESIYDTTTLGHGGEPTNRDAELLPRVFGPYLLLERLAGGGMGQVFRARRRDAGPSTPTLAIKRVLPELAADAELVSRFVSEARIARTLVDPRIVRVLDDGEIGGEHYLVMEFVDGADLATLLAAGARRGEMLPRGAALTIAWGLAQGLGAAHRRTVEGQPAPVVHRDVSPQNVLVGRDGAVKVTDFGIAQAAEKAVRTRSGVVIGRCRYMSPEQARGAVVDARSDVFSAAVVLFELLAGHPLFAGDSAEQVLRQVAGAPIPHPQETLRDCSVALAELLAQALDRDPDRRPRDGTVLGEAIEARLREEAPDYGAAELASLVQRWMPRDPAAASADPEAERGRQAPGSASGTTAALPPSAESRALPLAAALGGGSGPWSPSQPDPQAPTLLLAAPEPPPSPTGGGRWWARNADTYRSVARLPRRWGRVAVLVAAGMLGAGLGAWMGGRRSASPLPATGPAREHGSPPGAEAAAGRWAIAVQRVLTGAEPAEEGEPAGVLALELLVTHDGRRTPGAERWVYLRCGAGERLMPRWTTTGTAGAIVAFAKPAGSGALSLGLLAPGSVGASEIALRRGKP